MTSNETVADLVEAVARVEAIANLIDRPPLDDVWIERTVATRHASDLRALLSTLTSLEAERDRLREALKPFAACAEYDIGESEDDADTFRNTEYNLAPKITVGDIRRALSALQSLSGGNVHDTK